MHNFLKINNLAKQFIQNDFTLDVLKSVNYVFEQSKSYAITGISGSGKSTLIHLLSGTDEPTCGNVFFNDEDINKFSATQKEIFLNQSIGLVFQEPYLIKELTVIENIIIKGLINSPNIKHLQNEGMLLLQEIGLEHKASALPATLSVGQQQRVAIARAIFNKPQFLLADEPTANLDVQNAKIIFQLFDKFQNEHSAGIIIVTHDKFVIDNMQVRLHLENGELHQM